MNKRQPKYTRMVVMPTLVARAVRAALRRSPLPVLLLEVRVQ